MSPLPQSEHIETQWIDSGETILWVRMWDGVTWQEIKFLTESLDNSLRTRARSYYAVVDIQWMQQSMPLGGGDYPRLTRFLRQAKPIQKLIIFNSQNLATRMILQIAIQAYHAAYQQDRFRVVTSLLNATSIIAYHKQNSGESW